MYNKREIRISAKNLGSLAMPDACHRCFWIKNTIKTLPWQIFPGIFSSIDSYTKKMVHLIFDETGKAPAWLPELDDTEKYLKALHWSKFKRKDKETGITVTGMVDDIFQCYDGSRIIVDYKTAKYTKNQDKLLPLYEAQLNLYAWIEEGFGSIVRDDLPLIYCEPVTEPENQNYGTIGFALPFQCKTVLIKKDTSLVDELLAKVVTLLSGQIPEINIKCKDCLALEKIISL